jgi:hypothetical protein
MSRRCFCTAAGIVATKDLAVSAFMGMAVQFFA